MEISCSWLFFHASTRPPLPGSTRPDCRLPGSTWPDCQALPGQTARLHQARLQTARIHQARLPGSTRPDCQAVPGQTARLHQARLQTAKLHQARLPGWCMVFSSCLSIRPFVCLLPTLWIQYFENEWTDFDTNWHKWSMVKRSKVTRGRSLAEGSLSTVLGLKWFSGFCLWLS